MVNHLSLENVMSKIATVGSVLGLLLLASGQAGAQTDYSKVEMKTTDLGRRTYMIEGAGGNITAATLDHPWNRGLDGIISAPDWPSLARKLEPVLA